MAFLAFASHVNAQHDLNCYHADPGGLEREHSVDILHMKVDVKFDVNHPDGPKVMGKVNHRFQALRSGLDTLFFDGPGIKIHNATLDGKAVHFKTIPEGVVVTFSKSLVNKQRYEIEFQYEAIPRKGIYFIGWDRPEAIGKPDLFRVRRQIWTQGQGIDNRYWIPMYDNMNDKFTTETVVTFMEQYKVLSNGKLVSEKNNKNGSKTWHYLMEKPHAGYLLMLAIGNYEVKSTKTSKGTPVHFWYYPEFKDRVELTSLYTERMIEFLEQETGYPYPWGSYSQVMVQDFLFGAMENTSATVFGDFFFVNERAFDDRNYIGVNAHELTHQWFGDLITARSNNDIWLQENFATFYAKWFFGTLKEYGMDEVKLNQLGEYQSAFKASEKDNLPIRHSQSGTARAYPKGSAVLQMLRYVIGDEAFKDAIQYYLQKNAFANVQAADFQNAFKDRLGLNLDWFFEQWVLKGGEPHYKVHFNAIDKGTLVTVEQIHATDLVIGTFTMPVSIAVYYTDGSVFREKVWIDKHYQQVVINNPENKKVSFLVFDENAEIMKKLTFVRPFTALREQALKAVNMADRLEAVQAMQSFSFSEKQSVLESIYANSSEFHAIRSEALKQFLQGEKQAAPFAWTNNESNSKLIKNLPKPVRQTLAAHLSPESEAQRSLLVFLLEDLSYQVIETALDNLFGNMVIRSHPDFEKWAYNWLSRVDGIDGMNKAIYIKWLEYHLALKYDTNKANQLIDLCSADYEFRTRVAAFQATGRLQILNETLLNHFYEAMSRPNGRLAGPASAVLNTYKNQHSYKVLIHQTRENQSSKIKKHLSN